MASGSNLSLSTDTSRNATVSLSADARTALRQAVTNHPDWDAHRRANNLSLATMRRDDYFAVADALKIDIAKIAGSTTGASAGIGLANPAPARTKAEHDAAVAQAQADFANVSAVDDFAADTAPNTANGEAVSELNGSTEIPELPLPVTVAQVTKIDSIIALAVDPDISFSSVYTIARNAIGAAKALQAKLDAAPPADPRAAALAALAALVKPALDFVPPSWSRDFADFLAIGATIAVVGPAGNGKTTGARKLLERSGYNVYEFDCTDATLPQDLIGRTSLRQDNGATVTEWTAGPIAKAFADPKGAVLLNEYDALDPRTGMALQSALEAADVRRVTAPDSGEQIRSTGPCPIVLTLNTIGHGATVEYQGRNALDGANRDRIEIISTGYEAEREIMIAHGFSPETAQRLADWAGTARKQLAAINSREILSNRRLLTAAALIDRCGYAMGDAVRKSFVCRLPAREQTSFS